MIRAGLYERVSKEEQALHGYSIQAQVDELTKFALANDIIIVDHYTDEGLSGGKPAMKRPAMMRLLDDVKAGKIDIILFTKIDRWFRNVKQYYRVQDILDKHKVTWKTVLEDYDTSTANGSFMVNVMLSIAQQQRIRTSQRIKVVLNNKVKNGEAIIPVNKVPMGYIKTMKDGKTCLEKDPDTMEAVQAFWDTLYHTNSLRQAQKVLQDGGIYKSYTTLQQLVARGTFVTGEYAGVKDYCPAYITPDQLASIQSRGIKRAANGRVYLFTGLLICPVCNHKMQANYKEKVIGSQMQTFYCYRCNRHRSDPELCSFPRTISERKIERELLSRMAQLFDDYAADIRRRNERKSKGKVNITALRERQRRITTAYVNGAYTDDEYKQLFSGLAAQIAAAQSRRPQPVPDASAILPFVTADYRTIYDQLTRSEKQRFWRELIDEIHFDDNNLKSVKFRIK